MWFSSQDTLCSLLFSRLFINCVLAMVKVCFSKGTHRVKAALTTTIADQGHEWAENCMCIYNTKSNVSKWTWSFYVKIMSRIKAISWTGLKHKKSCHKHLCKEKSRAQHGKRTIEAHGLNSEAGLARYNYWKFSWNIATLSMENEVYNCSRHIQQYNWWAIILAIQICLRVIYLNP